MRHGSVDIPDIVLDAQLSGRLVVFAGAGISKSAPSSLPDFDELVQRIEVASGVKRREYREEPDVYLGRVDAAHFPVHDRVAERFAAEVGEPNAVHHAIINLFREAGSLRIVTTNYDRHLSSAAAARWPEGVQEATAPALPLGDKFTGIVHVHGAAGGPPENLVITDSDFGQAYLIRGYARRFLLDCFRKYVVLFVGYSFNDRVLNYLARGLPVEDTLSARFALVDAAEEDRWRLLGIDPIAYDSKVDPAEPHAPLREALEQWGRYTQMGFGDHAEQVRELVKLGPGGDPASQDYLRRQIRDPETVDFFCRVATDPAWLSWLESEPEFRDVFVTNSAEASVGAAFCGWFANRAVSAPAQAQATVARMGGGLSASLWIEVVRKLWHPHQPSEILLGWLPILMHTAPRLQIDFLSYLLKDSRPVEDDDFARLLFEFLTEPSAVMKPYPWMAEDGERYAIELVVRGDDHGLNESLASVFLPRIEVFAGDLFATTTRNLERAHALLQAAGQAGDEYDGLSFGRSAIEPHDQDERGQPDWVDALVNGARGAIDWAVEHDPALVRTHLALWMVSRCLLLRRLAVYLVDRAPWLNADEKLVWLVDHDWVFSTALHHEVYVLLATSYPQASDAGRKVILDRLDAGLPEGDFADDPDLRAYVVFSLVSWLFVATPDDKELKDRREASLAEHPDFELGPHPDMTHWLEVGGWTPPPSPVKRDKILQGSPTDDAFLASLTSSQDAAGDWPPGSRRRSLLGEVTEACVADPAWSLRLADALSVKGDWSSDLWTALFDAWSLAALGDEQWACALEVIRAHQGRGEFERPIARLLEDAVRQRPPRLPASALPLAKTVADELLDEARAGEPHSPWETANWLERAINEPAGQLMVFFVQALSLESKGGGQDSIPPDYRRRFAAVIEGETYADGLGKAVVASQLHFLHGLDRTWTSEIVLPLLDWQRSSTDAQQAWEGFLTMGRLSPDLVDSLLPLYESTFPHLADLGKLRDAFAEHLSLAAFIATQSPLDAGWLVRFLQAASEQDIVAWTRSVGYQLRHMPSDSRVTAWQTWLGGYWRMRDARMPRPISEEEGQDLVGWIPDLPDVFEEACDCACQMPITGADGAFYNRFLESGIAVEHPSESARLLSHLLNGEKRRFWACSDASAIAKAIIDTRAAAQEDVSDIKNELLRLGCNAASDTPDDA